MTSTEEKVTVAMRIDRVDSLPPRDRLPEKCADHRGGQSNLR
jgi:hypothetical protein